MEVIAIECRPDFNNFDVFSYNRQTKQMIKKKIHDATQMKSISDTIRNIIQTPFAYNITVGLKRGRIKTHIRHGSNDDINSLVSDEKNDRAIRQAIDETLIENGLFRSLVFHHLYKTQVFPSEGRFKVNKLVKNKLYDVHLSDMILSYV